MPHSVRLAALLTVLSLSFTGCDDITEIDTAVVFSMPSGELGEWCVDQRGVNLYIVDIFDYNGPAQDTGMIESQCRRCASDDPDVDCTLLRRECFCSGFRTEPAMVEEAMSGIRLEEIDDAGPVCMRIQVVNSESVPGGSDQGSAEVCSTDVEECRLDWAGSVDTETLEDRVSACGISDPYSLSDGSAPLVIRDFACSGWEDLFDLLFNLQERVLEVCDRPRDVCESVHTALEALCQAYPVICTESPNRFITLAECASSWD